MGRADTSDELRAKLGRAHEQPASNDNREITNTHIRTQNNKSTDIEETPTTIQRTQRQHLIGNRDQGNAKPNINIKSKKQCRQEDEEMQQEEEEVQQQEEEEVQQEEEEEVQQ